jgi:hypothetical protein
MTVLVLELDTVDEEEELENELLPPLLLPLLPPLRNLC